MADSRSRAGAGNQARAGNQAGAGDIARRRPGGLRALGVNLPLAARRARGRRGFADARLIADWAVIVGRTIAARSQPQRLSCARARERRDGTLVLRVAPGFALELQHLAPQLIERINWTLGYAAVSRLAFRQGPLPRRPAQEGEAREAPQEPRDAEDSNSPAELSAAIDDEGLRDALQELGRALKERKET